MKVIVTTAFKDRYTGEVHPVGAVLNIAKKRLLEIREVGEFIKEAEENANGEGDKIQTK